MYAMMITGGIMLSVDFGLNPLTVMHMQIVLMPPEMDLICVEAVDGDASSV